MKMKRTNVPTQHKSEIIIFKTSDEKVSIDVRFEGETVWLTIDDMVSLFERSRSTINEHILNIFEEGELEKESSVRKIGNSDFSTKPTNYYNLDVIIPVGYRVKSLRGTQFRQWATKRLNKYIRKGFTMDDERLKQAGGGDYWKELLARIRDIHSSEKVMYRQVLDLYATSVDYNPKSSESIAFFKMVQNKLHYAVNRQTAVEIVMDSCIKNVPTQHKSEIIIFKTSDEKVSIDVRFEGETVWLTIDDMVSLFERSRSTINEHILNIFEEGELEKESSVRKIGNSDFSTKPTNYYNLDVIIPVGYRVKSLRGTQFRQWATKRLNKYIRKGFTMDDERLKQAGGGDYWKELLARIRDIHSSEKVMYRQVLDLYATSVDYNPKSSESIAFFKMVQNKLHYAVNRQTAVEIVMDSCIKARSFRRIFLF